MSTWALTFGQRLHNYYLFFHPYVAGCEKKNCEKTVRISLLLIRWIQPTLLYTRFVRRSFGKYVNKYMRDDGQMFGPKCVLHTCRRKIYISFSFTSATVSDCSNNNSMRKQSARARSCQPRRHSHTHTITHFTFMCISSNL